MEKIMKNKQKKQILSDFENKCDCREDDNCGCSFPNNPQPSYEATCPKNLNQTDCCKNLSASKKA